MPTRIHITDESLQPSAQRWDSTYTTVWSKSANWDAAFGSAGADLAVRALTANWEETYSTFKSVSSTFLTSETDSQILIFNEISKELAISNGNFVSLSSFGTGADVEVRALTGKYDSVYNTVQSNSAVRWDYQGTDLKNLSSDWDSTYTTYKQNSATYATIEFANSKFFPLSGGTITGNLNILSSLEVGSGDVTLYVEDKKIGVNTETPNVELTINGSISSNSLIYGDGSQLFGVVAVNSVAGGDLNGTYPNPTIKNSVSLYGQPTAPTAAAGTNTNQIATTEFVQSNRGDRYLTTSTSSNTIDNSNNKTFIVASSGLAYTPTQDVTIVWSSDPLNYHMHCSVVSFSGYELVVDVNSHTGNGTHSNWTINVGGLTTQTGVLLQANNLNDVANAATALTNLGGVSATRTIYAGTGLIGGGDLTTDRTISVVFGNTSTTVVSGDDPRMSNPRTPLAHKASHMVGGSDYLSPDDIGALSVTTYQQVSGNWQSAYTNVNANSATTWNYQGTDLKALSANWQSAYTNVNANSGIYVKTVPTTTPGTSAVSIIVAVSALPVSPDPNTLYIVI